MRHLLLVLSSILGLVVSSPTPSVVKSISRGIKKEVVAVKNPIDQTISYVGSSQCSTVKKLVGVSYEQLEGEKEPDLNQLTLEYRDDGVRTVYNITTAADRITNSQDYKPRDKLIIFVHGFTDSPMGTTFGNISQAFLAAGNCSILALDASSLIKWLYLRSTTYVRFIGEKLGGVLAAMYKRGVKPSSIHMIGHSLGSHISGFTGKTFNELTGKKLGRISGLDPAGPCFSNVDAELKLKATDADFVDVIHTDAGVYGLDQAVGHVDFYPNGGSHQPECLLQACSHTRVIYLYASSVMNPGIFLAIRCRDWDHFKRGKCEAGDVVEMGYSTPSNTRGAYYLQTSGEAPYGLKSQGLHYKNDQGVISDVSDQAKNFANLTKNIFG